LSEEYDLKDSGDAVGQLYPVLVDAKGNVIDGFHRLEANPEWRKEKLENIDSEEKLLLARCISNWHRRQVSREEKEEWINGLAKIYKKQGLSASKLIGGKYHNEIIAKIVDKTGFSKPTITKHLDLKYKQKETHSEGGKYKAKAPASQVIETQFDFHRKGYGRQLVERHREEVLEEEKPKIAAEVREQTKKELLHNRDFQREVIKEIRKPKIVKPDEACPSGVCELPPVVETGDPLDVRAESIDQFFVDYPDCKCQSCKHYGKCGVIY
jgi:hypothetical protein